MLVVNAQPAVLIAWRAQVHQSALLVQSVSILIVVPVLLVDQTVLHAMPLNVVNVKVGTL